MMEKTKDNKFPRRKLWGCMGFLLFVCFGIFGLLAIAPSFFGRMPRTALAPELIPTAEALLNVPFSITVSSELGLQLDFLENYYDREDGLCVYAYYNDRVKNDLMLNSSSLFIDDVWIMGAGYTFIGSLVFTFTALNWCAFGELQAGIHLIEFHLKDSFWSEPIHIQQWAIEIE